MASKIGNPPGSALGGLLVVSLYVGRYLGLVGVLGLLARLIDWYKEWIWAWVVFVVVGFVSAALLERLQKSAH